MQGLPLDMLVHQRVEDISDHSENLSSSGAASTLEVREGGWTEPRRACLCNLTYATLDKERRFACAGKHETNLLMMTTIKEKKTKKNPPTPCN